MALKLIYNLISKIAKLVKKTQIPCYFPCFQGIHWRRTSAAGSDEMEALSAVIPTLVAGMTQDSLSIYRNTLQEQQHRRNREEKTSYVSVWGKVRVVSDINSEAGLMGSEPNTLLLQ